MALNMADIPSKIIPHVGAITLDMQTGHQNPDASTVHRQPRNHDGNDHVFQLDMGDIHFDNTLSDLISYNRRLLLSNK